MKKLMALMLSTVIGFGLVACSGGGSAEQEVEKEYPSYSRLWRTAEDEAEIEHDTGEVAIDGGWGSVVDTSSGALCRVKTDTLHNTAYTAVARLLVNEKSNSKTVAAVIRVMDADGKELGRKNVRLCDFDKKLEYKDFTFTFDAGKRTEATMEIYWPGNAYVRVIEFAIVSKTKADLPDFTLTGKELLGETLAEEEKDVAFEENALYYFDLNSYMAETADAEQAYDVANLVCTLQGLVNRDGQRLFIRFQAANGFSADTDRYWLDYMRQEGGYLADKKLVTVKSPATLLRIFDKYYEGFAAWDPTVPATVNAVATACGADNLLPVRYSDVADSLYRYVSTGENFKPVKVDLGGKFTGKGKIYGLDIDSTGSRKNDAYLWAKANYLDTEKTNSHMMAYHVDAYSSDTVFAQYGDLQNMFLSNRDYYIANKCFFFDLSVMFAETPDDDPDQQDKEIDEEKGTIDYQTFVAIMEKQNAYAAKVDKDTPIDVGGFTPWHLKYTRFTNPSASGEVACEWETVYQFSIYNAYINADAPSYTAMANASVYMNYPMQESYRQKASKEIKEELPSATEQGANYIMFYMGDFDASAWLNTAMIRIWNDEKRGTLPLCWTFSLNISKRAGHVVDMMYKTATENDYFVAGDNGVGYLNPQAFESNQSKDQNGDLDSWAAYNKAAYGHFDIDYTGILITRSPASEDIIKAYAKFSKGASVNFMYTGDAVEGFGICQSIDYSSINGLVSSFSAKKVGDKSSFTNIRFILRNPSDAAAIWAQLSSEKYKDYNFRLVDPYTFYGLMERQNKA